MTIPGKPSHILPDLVEPVNRYIHIPLAGRLVPWLKNTRITPNQVTYASVLFGLASAYMFSLGTQPAMVAGGLLLEVTLILDCVDGQLARAKGCASEWGRILDGIAGYIAYLAVVFGMMRGLGDHYLPLAGLTVLTILKAIAYDYCKQTLTSIIQQGNDATLEDIRKAYRNFKKTGSRISVLYFYYLQTQRLIFQGRWDSLAGFDEEREAAAAKALSTGKQRTLYLHNIQPLTAVWRWNGPDLVLFLFILLAVPGILKAALPLMVLFLGIQFILTLLFHHFVIRNETLA
ncbi:MAG: CDP-alcohol phosphatidyltransferase family protein [Nitrospinaceae bacterium]